MQPQRVPVQGMCLHLALLLAFTAASNAAVTNVAWYRLGENDPGGISGLAITNTTTDAAGTKHLKQYGSPLYTNAVSAGASNRIGSSLAVSFNGSAQYLSNAVVSTAVNNFGLEAWVKPNTTNVGSYYIAYNGFTGNNGWGFLQVSDTYTMRLGGGAYGVTGNASVGKWAHLALIRDNGTNVFYVNGIPLVTNTVALSVPTIGFAIGAEPLSPTIQNFTGAIDEVRVFTFAPGQFTTNDLLLAFSPVATTLPATAVTATSAILNGSVNPLGLAANGWFEWGTTTNYGNVTPTQSLGTNVGSTNFSQGISGLSIQTTYNFRAAVSNGVAVVYGSNLTFTTPVFVWDTAAGNWGSATAPQRGAAAWADYDNDGRLDLAVRDSASRLLRNTGTTFTNSGATLGGDAYGAAAWSDFNLDGGLDLAIGGQLSKNTGNGLTNVNTGFPTLSYSSIAWGDYDNDGRPDFLMSGDTNFSNGNATTTGLNLALRLWRNTTNGFVDIVNSTNGYAAVACGDYDNDGWLDFLSGSQLWRNTGNGFTNVPTGFPVIYNAPSVAWGDYDNDGRLDILIAGTGSGGLGTPICQVWRNTGSGFTNINAGLPGIKRCSVAWGDYDNDGRLDILLAGLTGDAVTPGPAIAEVWRNTGSGFTNINAALLGYSLATVAWGDYDNDGRLDFVLQGSSSNGLLQIWRNFTPVTNTPPAAPSGLAVTASGMLATFSWDPASDAQTPSSGLTYNVRIGTAPGGSDVLAPMAGANGLRRLPQMGNAQMRRFLKLNCTLGTTYYWSVQAIDTAFAGSAWSPESSFKLLQWDAPTLVVSPTVNSLPIGDYNGNGRLDESELAPVLSNYYAASPWLYLTNVAGLGSTNVSFTLSNSTAGSFTVEFTTNFLNWYQLGPAVPRYLFTDSNAPAIPQRYYRLRWP